MAIEPRALPDQAHEIAHSTEAFVTSLVRHGLAHCVVCPGSRSSPLTLAFAHSAIKAWVLVDERSAGYFAVGMAKALRAPVAIVTTSGTAAANLLPAVVEARYSATSLVVLTADRPPELRDSGALQTIDQRDLFGRFVNWFVDVELPSPSNDYSYVEYLAAEALRLAADSPAGPVHLNWPFGEPFVPEYQPEMASNKIEPPNVVEAASLSEAADDDVRAVATAVGRTTRGVIVCGPIDEPEFGPAVRDLAERVGFPILADPLSQLRSDGGRANVIVDSYDLLFRSPTVRSVLHPEIVIRFGMTPVSKSLQTYLSEHADAEQVSVRWNRLSNGPSESSATVIDVDPAYFASQLAEAVGDRSECGGWADRWTRLSSLARTRTTREIQGLSIGTDLKAVAVLAEELVNGSVLWVGSSMPMRDLDTVLEGGQKNVRIMGNRGVNGIDGVVSTALGSAVALGERVTLVIGDLSFYHDLNGLLAAKLFHPDVTVVLINNDGGGIFHFLPQVEHVDVFERFFATPTKLDFRHAVTMYGGRSARPDSVEEFRKALQESWRQRGLTVIEVATDRASNVQTHHAVWETIIQDVEESIKSTDST